MSSNENRYSPLQYLIDNLTKFSLLDFVRYFDFESNRDVKDVLLSTIKNALKLEKIRNNQSKVRLLKHLQENIDEVSESTLKSIFQ